MRKEVITEDDRYRIQSHKWLLGPYESYFVAFRMYDVRLATNLTGYYSWSIPILPHTKFCSMIFPIGMTISSLYSRLIF